MKLRIKIEKVDIRKNWKSRIGRLFVLWLILSITTTLVFYFQKSFLYNVDVPTHICAGAVIAVFIFAALKVENWQRALLLAFVPFILWEFIEIFIAHTATQEFLIRLFDETLENRVQDLLMDTLGFLLVAIEGGIK